MSKKYTLFLILSVLVACTDSENRQFDLIIARTNLIDGTGKEMQTNVNIYIKDGIIKKVDRGEVKGDEQVIDGSNKYVMPGLFDCHVHTSYEEDFPKFIHYGVTSVFVTGGGRCTNEYYKAMRDLGNQDSLPAPRVFHTSQHFTMKGRHPVKTYASPNWVEGETVFYLRDTLQIEALVRKVSSEPILGIKLTIEDGPHPPIVSRMPQVFINKVQKEAERQGLEVFAHVSDNEELAMAVKADIQNLVHFTGVDLDNVSDSLLQEIYSDSIDWVTTLMLDKSFQYPLYPEWTEVPALREVYSEADFEDMNSEGYQFRANDYVQFMKEYLKLDTLQLKNTIAFQVEDIQQLINNGVNMVLGTDTGNTFILPGYALHEEMQLMELGGMDPLLIIKLATLNAAKMMNVDDKLGSIEVGKMADLIVLNENPLSSISNSLTIDRVLKNGKIQERIR